MLSRGESNVQGSTDQGSIVPHPTRLSGRADSIVGNVGGFQHGKDSENGRAAKCKLVAEFSQVFGEPAQVVLGG